MTKASTAKMTPTRRSPLPKSATDEIRGPLSLRPIVADSFRPLVAELVAAELRSHPCNPKTSPETHNDYGYATEVRETLHRGAGVTASPPTFGDLIARLETVRERLGVAVGGLSGGVERLTGETLLPSGPVKPLEGAGQVARAHAIASDCFILLDLLDELVQRGNRQC